MVARALCNFSSQIQRDEEGIQILQERKDRQRIEDPGGSRFERRSNTCLPSCSKPGALECKFRAEAGHILIKSQQLKKILDYSMKKFCQQKN